MTAAALTPDEFAARLQGLDPPRHLAVAVSGGADSLALAALTQGWAEATDRRLVALIVDHRLREGSTVEAERTAAQLAARGLEARILTLEAPWPAAGLEEEARNRRYRALTTLARDIGCQGLMLAHHRDDQAETVLLRLAAGSGPDGLAGMAPRTMLDGIVLLRPLLDILKTRLEATCTALGLAPILDPMNADPAHARPRLRAAREVLEREGLSALRLARLATRQGRARAALEGWTAELLDRHLDLAPIGYGRLPLAPVQAAPAEIRIRVLAALLRRFGGAARAAGLAQVEDAAERVFASNPPGQLSLGGCLLRPQAEGTLLIMREPGRLHERLRLGSHARHLWDARFIVETAGIEGGIEVAALGRALRHLAPAVRRTAPQPALQALPALWREGRLLAVPPLNLGPGPLLRALETSLAEPDAHTAPLS